MARRSEEHLIADAMRMDATEDMDIFTKDCNVSRSPLPGCVNNLKCRNRFKGLDEKVKALRSAIYLGDRDTGFSDGRKNNLKHYLNLVGLRSKKAGETVAFLMGGEEVCKDFFRRCTGMRRQYFNEIIEDLLEQRNIKVKTKKKSTLSIENNKSLITSVTAALDNIFQ